MSEVNTDDLAQQLGQLTIMQLLSLTKKLEADWGVSATPATVAVPVGVSETKEAQTEFTVVLMPVSAAAKMNCIKAIRDLLTIGLKEAKDFVEGAPKSVKEGVSKEEADMLAARLTEVGAVTEIK